MKVWPHPLAQMYNDSVVLYITFTHDAQGSAEWSKHQLNDAQVEQFWSQGYLSNIPVLSVEQCEKLLKDYWTFLVRRIPMLLC